MKKIILLVLLLLLGISLISLPTYAFTTNADIFEPVTITSVSMNADPLDADRRIAIYKVAFVSSFSELTITFDDVSGLSDGLPAIYFNSQPTSMNTLSFLQMNINGTGGLGNNLFYFNDPVALTDNEVYVHISIDSVLDIDYINNASAIIYDARFSFMDPYTFTTHVGLYTDTELLELVSIARQEGFNDALLANQTTIDNAVTGALDDVHLNGFDTYGYDETGSFDYKLGYQLGRATNVNAGLTTFMSGFQKWIVPAIVIIILLGGFITIAVKKRNEG